MTIVYQSKIDWWIAVILILGPLTTLGLGCFILSLHKPLGCIIIFVAISAVLIIALLTMPCRYTLTDTDLKIQCGLIRQQIQLKNIQSVELSSNPLSAPALSLKRVKITFENGFQLVSPEDREGFIHEIRNKIKKD